MKRLESRSSPQVNSLQAYSGDACFGSADPVVVVFLRIAGGGNPLRASSRTAGFGIGFKVQRTRLHDIHKMRPNQCVIKGGKRGHGQFSKRLFYHKQQMFCSGTSLFATNGGEGTISENPQVFYKGCS